MAQPSLQLSVQWQLRSIALTPCGFKNPWLKTWKPKTSRCSRSTVMFLLGRHFLVNAAVTRISTAVTLLDFFLNRIVRCWFGRSSWNPRSVSCLFAACPLDEASIATSLQVVHLQRRVFVDLPRIWRPWQRIWMTASRGWKSMPARSRADLRGSSAVWT